jgi:hypothetical protein
MSLSICQQQLPTVFDGSQRNPAFLRDPDPRVIQETVGMFSQPLNDAVQSEGADLLFAEAILPSFPRSGSLN